MSDEQGREAATDICYMMKNGALNALNDLEKGRVDLAREVLQGMLVYVQHVEEGKSGALPFQCVPLLPPGGKWTVLPRKKVIEKDDNKPTE